MRRVVETETQQARAFVFPGQGGGVEELSPETFERVREVLGDELDEGGVPDQVKLFVRAARDADEVRALEVLPDVVAGHSLGEYGAAYSAGCFSFASGVWLVALRDRFLAEVAREVPGGMVAILRARPEEIEQALSESPGSFVANYNSPKQTVVSGLRGALGEAVAKIKGRKVPLNVSFAAHSPYVATASERMREALDQVEFSAPKVPVVSAIDGSVLTTAEAVREALKGQMISPVRWVKVVETLVKLRVGEWVELGGGGVLTRMLRDFELPSISSIKGITFDELRQRLTDGTQNLLARREDEPS